jgi:hypothetical protein
MTAKAVRSTALALTAVLGSACSSGPTPPEHGSPVLTKVFWVAGGAPVVAWSPTPDPFLVSPVPPFATEIDFVFDRRLDGDLIEDTVIVDGNMVTRPKAMPPIEVLWPGMADRPGNPPLELRVAYNAVGRFGDDTSYVFAKPIPPGFPSSETLTFVLHRESLASAYGEPADAPDKIPVTTAALTVSIMGPAGPVPLTYQLPLGFTNRMVFTGGTSPFIHVVTASGGAVPYKLLPDASQASRWYVAPADCLGAWPAGASLTVTIDAGLPDAFGGTLVQMASATFTTGPTAGAASAATCGITPPDAGSDASDAGAVMDAGDGGAPEVGGDASDAADGGVPDAAGDAADAPASFDAADAPASFDAADVEASPDASDA